MTTPSERALTSASAPIEPANSWRSAVRATIVVLVSLISLVVECPDIVLPWHPTATMGFVVDAVENVIAVAPGLSAARAGIETGDRIDLLATPFVSRAFVQPGAGNVVRPGQPVTFVLIHEGVARTVVVAGNAVERSLADNVTDVILIVAQAALVFVGALLLLKRPSRMTWAFFFYCNAYSTVAVTDVSIFPAWLLTGLTVVFSSYGLQWIWLALFSLRFPGDAATGWRRPAERVLLCSFIVFAPVNVYAYAGPYFGYVAPSGVTTTLAVCSVLGLLFTILTFVLTYAGARAADRARIRWVMLGLITGFAGTLTEQLFGYVPGIAVSWPIWLINITQASQLLVALSIAYAVIRHRVFDVRFFIGRAVVYGVLGAGVVTTLTLVDYAAGKVLSGTGLAAIGDAGIAIVIGLTLNGVHKRIESVVDATLFRSRIDAERRLRRVSRGLSHAVSIEAIERVVIEEPHAAFRLASAAFFARGDDGRYVRGPSAGWEDASLTIIERDSAIALALMASKEPITITSTTLPVETLPPGSRRPTIAMPIGVRNDLEAIVFYGAHESQEDLDPDEVETLEHLLTAASGAYDHVRAQTAQAELADLRALQRGASVSLLETR